LLFPWTEDRTAKFHLLPFCATEFKFADKAVLYTSTDKAALYASTREGFEEVASSSVCVVRGCGLTVSLIKSKSMVAGIRTDTSVVSNHCGGWRCKSSGEILAPGKYN